MSIAFLMLAGCKSAKTNTGSWNITFADPALKSRTSAIDLSIGRGTCLNHNIVYASVWVTGGAVEAPPQLSSGTYALRARARDGQCLWFADGCTEVILPAGDGTVFNVNVAQSRFEELAPNCAPNVSPPSLTDASSSLDSGIDASTPPPPPPPPTCNANDCEGKRCLNNTCGYFKHCRDLKNTVGSAISSGVYTFDADELNPGAAPTYQAYCDMVESDGGWTLVARSVVGASGESFGWKQSRGSVSDDGAPYSINVEEKQIDFTEILIGRRAAGKSWDNFIYRLTVGTGFLALGTDSVDFSGQLAVVRQGACTPPSGLPVMLRRAGYTDKADSFFFRDNAGDLPFGLYPSVFQLNDGSDACQYSGGLQQREGMIFVR